MAAVSAMATTGVLDLAILGVLSDGPTTCETVVGVVQRIGGSQVSTDCRGHRQPDRGAAGGGLSDTARSRRSAGPSRAQRGGPLRDSTAPPSQCGRTGRGAGRCLPDAPALPAGAYAARTSARGAGRCDRRQPTRACASARGSGTLSVPVSLRRALPRAGRPALGGGARLARGFGSGSRGLAGSASRPSVKSGSISPLPPRPLLLHASEMLGEGLRGLGLVLPCRTGSGPACSDRLHWEGSGAAGGRSSCGRDICALMMIGSI